MSDPEHDAWAYELANEWIAGWNSGDLDRILAHYSDDFEMRSPLIAARGFAPSGVLRGKPAIRLYWAAGLATAKPPLHFELIDVYVGANTVAIHYTSVGRKRVVEVLEVDAARRVIRGSACYGPDAEPA